MSSHQYQPPVYYHLPPAATPHMPMHPPIPPSIAHSLSGSRGGSLSGSLSGSLNTPKSDTSANPPANPPHGVTSAGIHGVSLTNSLSNEMSSRSNSQGHGMQAMLMHQHGQQQRARTSDLTATSLPSSSLSSGAAFSSLHSTYLGSGAGLSLSLPTSLPPPPPSSLPPPLHHVNNPRSMGVHNMSSPAMSNPHTMPNHLSMLASPHLSLQSTLIPPHPYPPSPTYPPSPLPLPLPTHSQLLSTQLNATQIGTNQICPQLPYPAHPPAHSLMFEDGFNEGQAHLDPRLSSLGVASTLSVVSAAGDLGYSGTALSSLSAAAPGPNIASQTLTFEFAKSSKSTCKSCVLPISSSSPRIGVPHPKHKGQSSYYHPACAIHDVKIPKTKNGLKCGVCKVQKNDCLVVIGKGQRSSAVCACCVR